MLERQHRPRVLNTTKRTRKTTTEYCFFDCWVFVPWQKYRFIWLAYSTHVAIRVIELPVHFFLLATRAGCSKQIVEHDSMTVWPCTSQRRNSLSSFFFLPHSLPHTSEEVQCTRKCFFYSITRKETRKKAGEPRFSNQSTLSGEFFTVFWQCKTHAIIVHTGCCFPFTPW